MICGIDEAGRGAIAGPLVVAGVILKRDIKGLDDSKKLTSKKREDLKKEIEKNSYFEIVFIENSFIDEFGISAAINRALKKIKNKLKANRFIFDGNSNFGVKGIENLIKGDTKVKEIMAASILAKVSRDKFMCELDKIRPEYNFCKHKGYGTKEHFALVKKYGLSKFHRKSFIKYQKTLPLVTNQ